MRLYFSALLFFAVCVTGHTQNDAPPAFVMLEEVVVKADDPRFAPLFYSASETGEGSLVYDLIDLVKTGKIEVSSYIVGENKTDWNWIQQILGKREKDSWVFNEIVDGKRFTGTLKKEIPYSLKKVKGYRLFYVTCYDEKFNLVTRDFAGLSPLIPRPDDSLNFRGYDVGCFSLKEPLVKAILEKKCTYSSFSSMSYLTFLRQIPVVELDPYAHFITTYLADSLSDELQFKKPSASVFSYPEFVNSSACVVMKDLEKEKFQDSVFYIYANDFYSISNIYNSFQKHARSFGNIPFYKSEKDFGYTSIFDATESIVYQCLDVYTYDSINLFTQRLDSLQIFALASKIDSVEVFDPFTGEHWHEAMIGNFECAVFRILELHDGSEIYPIALCVGKYIYDENWDVTGYKPIFWIPFNQQFISILNSHQAYLPGYPQQLTLWGYLLSGMYKGKIISERPIDNAEWQTVREVLK